jgi:aspartate-semialdehyde dehydrogenase
MKIAVMGATGLVGTEMLKVLEERAFPITELILVASEKSVGKEISFMGKQIKVVSAETAIEKRPNIALFSAGSAFSLEYAPKFAEVGTVVIDNSSAWRMQKDIALVVPEVNGHVLTKNNKIIANPNCSTIQMVLVLAPLHQKYGIKRIVVSTYQSVTGTGKAAIDQLQDERAKSDTIRKVYPYQIDLNILPHIDSFLDNGYTKEEMKMVNETKKILGDNSVRVTATAVRVPVMGGHSESVNVKLHKKYDLEDIKNIMANTEGVILLDEPSKNIYPMPLFCQGRNEVFVGRIRRDESSKNALNMWIVADNLRKGAATNAVQIAEYLYRHDLV